jgi:hypothetical protein
MADRMMGYGFRTIACLFLASHQVIMEMREAEHARHATPK